LQHYLAIVGKVQHHHHKLCVVCGVYRLIGPLVVIGYLQKGWVSDHVIWSEHYITLSCQQEPKTLSVEHPVFSLAMSGLVVCHTAIGKEKRVSYSDLSNPDTFLCMTLNYSLLEKVL